MGEVSSPVPLEHWGESEGPKIRSHKKGASSRAPVSTLRIMSSRVSPSTSVPPSDAFDNYGGREGVLSVERRGLTAASSCFIAEHGDMPSSRVGKAGVVDGRALWVDLLSLGKQNSSDNILFAITEYLKELQSMMPAGAPSVSNSKVFLCVGVVGMDESTCVSVSEAWGSLKSENTRSTFKRKFTGGTVMYSRVELFLVSLPEPRVTVPSSMDSPSKAYSALEVALTREIKKYLQHNKMWAANGVRATSHN